MCGVLGVSHLYRYMIYVVISTTPCHPTHTTLAAPSHPTHTTHVAPSHVTHTTHVAPSHVTHTTHAAPSHAIYTTLDVPSHAIYTTLDVPSHAIYPTLYVPSHPTNSSTWRSHWWGILLKGGLDCKTEWNMEQKICCRLDCNISF